MADKIAELRASIEAYTTNVQAMIDTHKTTVEQAVADAIKADDAAEDVDLDALKAKVDEANAKLVVPPFDPSANG